MPSPRHYVIYGLTDPDTAEVRYIGKSVIGLVRATAHAYPSKLHYEGVTYKTNWIWSLLRIGKKPTPVVLAEYERAEQLVEAERFFIKKYRDAGSRLTNATDGGEGPVGRVLSKASRKRMARAARNREKPSQEALALLRAAHLATSVTAPSGPARSGSHRDAIARARSGRRFVDQNGTVHMNVRDTARKLGLLYQNVLKVLNKRCYHTKGFTFRYLTKKEMALRT